MAITLCMSTNSVWGFSFLYILANTCSH
jgi:hypothetical protein